MRFASHSLDSSLQKLRMRGKTVKEVVEGWLVEQKLILLSIELTLFQMLTLHIGPQYLLSTKMVYVVKLLRTHMKN